MISIRFEGVGMWYPYNAHDINRRGGGGGGGECCGSHNLNRERHLYACAVGCLHQTFCTVVTAITANLYRYWLRDDIYTKH